MESGKISDDQISASSSFYDGRWLPRQARLNNEDNAWTPSEDSNKEYIQVGQTFYCPAPFNIAGNFFFLCFCFPAKLPNRSSASLGRNMNAELLRLFVDSEALY